MMETIKDFEDLYDQQRHKSIKARLRKCVENNEKAKEFFCQLEKESMNQKFRIFRTIIQQLKDHLDQAGRRLKLCNKAATEHQKLLLHSIRRIKTEAPLCYQPASVVCSSCIAGGN